MSSVPTLVLQQTILQKGLLLTRVLGPGWRGRQSGQETTRAPLMGWLDDAEVGVGCNHCPYAPPVVYVAVKRSTVALCWLCAKIATGWTTEELERATRPFEDHLDVALSKTEQALASPSRRGRPRF